MNVSCDCSIYFDVKMKEFRWIANQILHCLSFILMQDEELDEHKVQITPPGFHIIFLPFADDFRKVKYEETPRGKNSHQATGWKLLCHVHLFGWQSGAGILAVLACSQHSIYGLWRSLSDIRTLVNQSNGVCMVQIYLVRSKLKACHIM